MSRGGKRKKVREAADHAPSIGALIKHGWTLYAHPMVLDQIEKLEQRVQQEGNPQSEAAKVLAWITRAIFEEIPQDPTLAIYRQGGTLGPGKTHWFRDKYAGRFRLFFRYNSRAKIIIYGWVNDANTLRAYGAKTDAYAVFRGMLDKGCPPNEWDDLLREASSLSAAKRLKRNAG